MNLDRRVRLVSVCVLVLLFLSPVITAPLHAQSAGPQAANVTSTWKLLQPDLSTETFNAVAMASTNDGWIVGDNGTSFRWDGSTWNSVPTGVSFDINWVDTVPGTTTGEAWAVGVNSTAVLHFTGSAWEQVSVTAPGQLDAVWMVSPTDGWMVGAGGGLLRYESGSWNAQTSGVAVQLHDIEINPSDPDDGWAVGEDGTILRWNGSTWTELTPHPTVLDLFNVAVIDTDNAWIVGGGSAQAIILHWDGVDWTEVSSPVQTHLWSVQFLSADNGWATGNVGTVLHWNGTTWSQAANGVTNSTLYDVDMVGPTDGWMVGGIPPVDSPGTVLRNFLAVIYLPTISKQ